MAEVEVIESVAINVADGESVVAEVVHGEDFFDAALPVVNAMAEVVGEVGSGLEKGTSGVGEERLWLGAGDKFAFLEVDRFNFRIFSFPQD